MVCGYCSTGCSLDVHLATARRSTSRPTTDYPVNLGMACPKGWEALTPLAAADRATTPLLRDAARQARAGRLGRRRSTTFVDRFKAIHDRARRRSRWPSCRTGQIPTEEMALLGALAKFGMGMVHGDGNTRQCMATSVVAYKQAFGFDAPPYTYADFEESDVHRARRLEPVHRPPDHVGAGLPQPARPRDHRRRPRAHRDGDGRHAAPARSRPKSDLVAALRPRPPADRARAGSTASSSTPTPPASTTFAAFVAAFTPERVARGDRARPSTQLERLADTIHDGERVSFWWTMGVNQSHEGVAHRAGDHQPRPDDRQHRPARHRRQLDHRPVQRDGLAAVQQHHEPARRPRLRQRRRTAHEVADILGIDVARIPDRPSLAYDQIIEGIRDGTIKGLWVIATNPAHSWINQDRPARRCSTGSTSSSCRTCTPRPRPPQLRRPRAARRRLGREGRHVHQLRAAHRPDQAGVAGARPGAGRLRHLPAHRRRLGLRRPVRASGSRPRPCSRSSSGSRPAGPATSPASTATTALDAHGGIQWPFPAGSTSIDPAPSAACSRTAASTTPTAGPGSCSRSPRPVAEAVSDRVPARAADRPRQLQPVAHPDPHGEVGGAALAERRRRRTSRCRRTTPARRGLDDGDVAVVVSPRGIDEGAAPG